MKWEISLILSILFKMFANNVCLSQLTLSSFDKFNTLESGFAEFY